MPNGLRSMLAGKMGTNAALQAGIKPGMDPMANPAVGGGVPPGVAGPGGPSAPPPMETMPGAPGTPPGDDLALLEQEAARMDPQLADLIEFLKDMPPEQIVEWATQLPPEAQEGFIQLASIANPAVLGYLSEMTGIGPDDIAGMAQQGGGQVPAGMGPMGPEVQPPGGMGPGGPPGGMGLSDQIRRG